MSIYTTEIASTKLTADRPIHLRILKAYEMARPYIRENVLELGCGEGRGIHLILDKLNKYSGIDKNQTTIKQLKSSYPQYTFIQNEFPPVNFPDASFETVISFQVIEHIKNDKQYLEQIFRILKPGGVALLSTPNAPMTLSRNPWHEREYTATELHQLCSKIFDDVVIQGITGNAKVMEYYEKNKQSVNRTLRFDVFNMHHRLPNSVLRIPYEILNRLNRNKLQKQSPKLVENIILEDFFSVSDGSLGLDLFAVLRKKCLQKLE